MVTASGFVARLPSIPMTHADDPIRIDGIEAKAENIELFLGWVHGELPLDLKVGTETFTDILVIVDFFEATDLASKIATALKGNLEVQMPLAKESIEAACDVAEALKDRVAEYILHHTAPTGRGREKSLNDIMVMNDMLKFFRFQDLKEASPASVTATQNYTAKLLKKVQKVLSMEDLQAKDLLFFGSTPTGGANSDPVFGSRSLRSEWKACGYSLEAKTHNHSTKVNIPLFLPESGISLVRPKKANRVPVSFAGREELPSSSESDEEEALLSGGRGRVSVSTTNTKAFFSVHCKISAIGSHCRLILRDGNGGQLQIMRSDRDLTDTITNPASLQERGVFCVDTSDGSVWMKKFEQGSQFHFAGGLSLQNAKECLIQLTLYGQKARFVLEELGSIERHWDLETTLPLDRDRRTKMQTVIRELQVAIAERNLFASDVIVSEEVPAPWSAGNGLKLFRVLLLDNRKRKNELKEDDLNTVPKKEVSVVGSAATTADELQALLAQGPGGPKKLAGTG